MRLGADPEIFLQDKTGKHISSIGYINANKWAPFQIPDMPKGFTLQEDNVSLEYGIPPAASADEFVAHIQAVMDKSLEYLPKLSFSKLSCVIFPEDQMQTAAAHVFGCEPDFDAWTKEVNPAPKPAHQFMRSAGGHVHVETKIDPIIGVRAMDLVLGVPSVIMDKDGATRRAMYGKRGAFRPKPYGFEYRTLSNFWISPGGTDEQRDKYCRWIWRNTERALAMGDVSHEDVLIYEAINKNNIEAAKQLIKKYDLEVV